jgi:hypothetical protein
VPSAFEALKATWKFPQQLEKEWQAKGQNVNPAGRFVTASAVAPLASN